MSKILWLGCTLELLCVWPVFLGGLEGSAKQSFCEVYLLCNCQVLLKERDKSEKLECYPKESCSSERNYSLVQCTKVDLEGKKLCH